MNYNLLFLYKMAETKIYFLTTIKKMINDNKRIYFTYDDINLSGENSQYIKTKRIEEKDGFYIKFNEFEFGENLLSEQNEEDEDDEEGKIKNIKIYLVISNLSDEDKYSKKYEIIINYEPNRRNFIFNLNISNSIGISFFGDNRFEHLPIDFNYNFLLFYNQKKEINVEYQYDYHKNLAKDTLSYLEEKKNEILDINFEIIIFLLLYIKDAKDKNSHISTLLEALHLKRFTYNIINIYKKEDINHIVEDIFIGLENNKKAWPFNEIQKFEKGFNTNNEEEEDEEEEEEEEDSDDLNMNKTELKFIEFLLGYYSKNGNLEDLKIFLSNNIIKNKTTEVLSQIQDDKIISMSCREKFIKLFADKNEVLEKLQISTDIVEYFKIINDNYTEIYELLKKVGMRKYDIKFQNIIIDTDLKEVREIHKQIIEKEKMENNNFLNFMPFIQKSINVFKDNKLDQLIYLNEFIEEEEKVYIANNKELNAIKNNLGIAVRSTINGINRTKFKEYDIYLLEIMPKINQYLNEEDRFSLFQNTKLNSNEKEIAEKIFDIIIKNKLFIYFDNKKKFFNNVIKNIKGIEYIKYIAQIASGIKDIADELYNWVSNNIKSYKKELKLNIKEDLFSVFGNLINYNQANQLLKLIWNNINDKEATEIFIYFLENISLYKLYLNYNFHQKIIDYFFKDINYPITIPNVLANQEIKKCQKMKDYIFAELKNKIISLDEFYYYNTTPNIELIEELKKNNFFNDEIYQNYEYTKKTVELINKIKSNFENGDLIYEKASIIFSNFIQWNDYQYKFRSIFLFNEKNDDENILRLSMKFKDDVIKIQTSLTDLEEIKKFFVEFYKNSKQKEISDINDLNNLLTKNKLKLYIEIINKDTYKNIIKYIEEALNINKLNKESYCFKQIYEEEKLISQRNQGENNEDKENEYNILKNTIQKFNDLKNIFENEKNKSVDNTNKFLIEIFLKYSDEELLYKEIKFLKFYFNINMKDEIIRKIKMNIIILALNNSINYILLGLKEINNIFKENIEQNVEDDILKKIDEYLVIIENENIEREKKEEILTFLKKFNIYLLGEEEQKIEFDINNKKDNIKYNIQNRKRFLEFLKLIKNDPSSIYFILTQNEKNAKFLLEYLVESDEKKNLKKNINFQIL